MSGGLRLDWALLAAFDRDRVARVPPDLARVFQVAGESLNLVARPVERFELAGTLNHHPGHVRSDRAKQNFPGIFALAVAGRCAREPLRTHSRGTAASALLSWAQVYRPAGNPIDEWFFVPLLQAVDLVAWSLPRGEQATLLDWARAFAVSGARFYERKPGGNSARSNNWMARRPAGPSRSSTPRMTPAPSFFRPSTASRSAGPGGRSPLACDGALPALRRQA